MKTYSPVPGKEAKDEKEFKREAKNLDLIKTDPTRTHAGVFDRIHGNDIENLYIVRVDQQEIVLKAEGSEAENIYMKLNARRPRWYKFWQKPWIRVELMAVEDDEKVSKIGDDLAEILASGDKSKLN
jgi:hypothetical protein